MYEPEKYIIVVVEGEKERVIKVLDQLAKSYPEEHWRAIRKKTRSNDYRGRACFTVENS